MDARGLTLRRCRLGISGGGEELLGKGGSLTFIVNMIELRDGARFGGIFREISKMLKVLY